MVPELGAEVLHIGKVALSYTADLSGVNALARARHRDSILVLSYHGVAADEYIRHPLWLPNMITVSEFRQQMREVARLFAPISADDFREWVHGRKSLPHNPVLVTFDDGYANNLTHAVPILNEIGVPALFFIVTGYIGQPEILWPTEIYLRVYLWSRSWIPLPTGGTAQIPEGENARIRFAIRLEESCKRLPAEKRTMYMCRLRSAQCNGTDPITKLGRVAQEMFGFLDWEQVRTLNRLGFRIGSHTVEHPILACVPPSRLATELQASKVVIERETGRECFCFAYPNGSHQDFTPATAEAVRQAGYEFAFTLMGKVCRQHADPMLFDRIWIPGRLDLRSFRTRASAVYNAVKCLVFGR
jgi:peptidoglycan/xylan/chitin deacetylase (PgdA/CDA1 family)